MNKNNIITILSIIVITLVILLAIVFMNNTAENKPKIYNNTMNGLGTFNTINVTNFTFDTEKTLKQII